MHDDRGHSLEHHQHLNVPIVERHTDPSFRGDEGARAHVRDILTLVFVVLTTPFWGMVRIFSLSGRDDGVFKTFGQLFSLVPGYLGACSRRAYYVMTLEACARDVGVGFGTWFSKRRVRVDPKVSFGAHCLIGSCSIGEGALFGSNIDVLSGRHQHAADETSNVRARQDARFAQIQIGRNSWIGNSAVIMDDVGDNSVIGAGSVVVHSVPANVVAVGNPARVVRSL